MKTVISYCTGGLGNRIFPLASCIAFAKQTSRKLLIYWPKDFRCDAEFSDIFDDIYTVIDTSYLESLKDSETQYLIKFPDSANNDQSLYGRSFLNSKLGISRRDLHPEHDDVYNLVISSNNFIDIVDIKKSQENVRALRLHKKVRERVEQYATELNLDKTITGMHVRATDFGNPGDWFSWLSHRVREEKRIFICSDDFGIEARAKSEYPNHVIVRTDKTGVKMNNPQTNSWVNNVYTSKKALQDAIIDLYLLGKTEVCYYNNLSSFGRYAKLLSEIQND